MLCPACNSKHFESVKIEAELPVERCADCNGVWVDLDTYRIWRKRVPEIAAQDYAGNIETAEGNTVRICPKSGRMMARIRVSNANPLRLDYSAVAQGVWLDRGEWDSLIALGLHKQLDAIVSERWQRELKEAAGQERLAQTHRTRFGDAAYVELLRIRHWLKAQPHAAEMLAFLHAKAD